MSIYAKTGIKAIPGSCAECVYGERYGLVGDMYCKILGEYFTGNVKPPHKMRPDECPLVELPASMAAQLNEPLTLEELREMVNQPVWVQFPDFPECGSWRIVAGVDTEDGERTLYCWGDYTCRDYGETRLAYRRPPKDGGAP